MNISEILGEELSLIGETRLINKDLILAAMDSIIDKDEKKIQAERQKVIDDSVAAIIANCAQLQMISTFPKVALRLKASSRMSSEPYQST